MEAMNYEYLIRRVYNCGRNYSKGADADIYRQMQHAHNDLTTKTMYKTQNEREYEYRSSFAAVRGNVDKAIKEGIKQVNYTAKKEDITELQTMSADLTMDFYDKSKLDTIISRADKIFHSCGLEMR
jgi:hypothetical protein